MTEMIERVARAIDNAMASDDNMPADFARAAIVAMREPTQHMLEEGGRTEILDGYVDDDLLRSAFRAMIDAATDTKETK